jgi:AcrR family transcriptional regulator
LLAFPLRLLPIWPVPDVATRRCHVPKPSREAPYGEPTRERILIEASSLFARRGYHGTSTRAIADAVGIRQPSMFHHFSSKSEVMKALLRLSLTPARDLARGLANADGSAAERLACYELRIVDSILRSPFNLVGMFNDDVLETQEFEIWRRDGDELRGYQRDLITQGIEKGEFLPVEPSSAQYALEGLVIGVIRLHRGRPIDDVDATVTEVTTLAIRMLLADPATAPAVVRAARTMGPAPVG